MSALATPARSICFAAAVATVVVGVVHAVNSFRGSTAALRWSQAGFIDENNEAFAEAFLLTPYQIAKHWQPLLLGYLALGQVRAPRALRPARSAPVCRERRSAHDPLAAPRST